MSNKIIIKIIIRRKR